MPPTQREYIEIELSIARATLAAVEDSSRQTDETPAGQDYRKRLRADIAHLEERLASEEE